MSNSFDFRIFYSLAIFLAEKLSFHKMESYKNVSTKQIQFEMLTNFMYAHPDLAKGYLKTADARKTSANLWKRVATDLNTVGPPMRDAVAWKKVWADHKTYVKGKLRKNRENISGTGGGPSKRCIITPLEEKVIELLDIESAVDGVSGAKGFGTITPEQNQNQETIHYTYVSEVDEMDYEVDNLYSSIIEEATTPRATPSSSRIITPKAKQNLLQKQVNNQDEYQKNHCRILSDINGNLKTIARYKRKQFELDEKKYKLAKEKFEFTVQNEIEKNKLNIKKIEIKKQILSMQALQEDL